MIGVIELPEQIPPASQSVNSMVDAIHGIAQSHTPMEAMIGKVISPPPNLQIAWNNIVLTREQLYIDVHLLSGYYREVKGHIKSGTQIAGHHEHTHAIDNDYTETYITTDTLRAGDLVSVLPIKGGQQFIILGRVIYLGEQSKDPHNKK